MTQPLTFVVLNAARDDLSEIRTALAADGRGRLLMASEETDQISQNLMRWRPSAVIVMLGQQSEPAPLLIERIVADCPDTMVICASRNASPDLILRSLRSGAREFLRLPVIPEEFKIVLDRTAEFGFGRAEAPKKRGRVVAVFSSKGGCGVSFIAANLAAAINKPTVLVDFNLQTGDLDLFLGVEPKFSVADLVENRARLDDSLLHSYLVPHSPKLSLVAAPREAGSAEDIRPEHIFDVIQVLRERYSYIVLDTPHTFDENTLAALDQSDEILLVLSVDIPSIRSAQRALQIFDRLSYPRHKVRVVINRWSKQIDPELQKVERYIGDRVVGHVPSDYRAVVSSINLGQPLVESQPSSIIAREIKRIAATITGSTEGRIEQESRSSRMKSIFRRSAAPESLSLRETLDKA